MDFLDPQTYTDLCPKCRGTLERITGLFTEGLMPDTDDPEAPMMYLYDHGMLCQKFECAPALELEEVGNA